MPKDQVLGKVDEGQRDDGFQSNSKVNAAKEKATKEMVSGLRSQLQAQGSRETTVGKKENLLRTIGKRIFGR